MRRAENSRAWRLHLKDLRRTLGITPPKAENPAPPELAECLLLAKAAIRKGLLSRQGKTTQLRAGWEP